MIYKHSNITDLIIKAFFNVYNKLGYGFLEKVYENAMVIELRKLGLDVINQKGIKVEVGLLINFGKSAQFKRKIFDNNYKIKTNTINYKSV
jgi:hypothetical protein